MAAHLTAGPLPPWATAWTSTVSSLTSLCSSGDSLLPRALLAAARLAASNTAPAACGAASSRGRLLCCREERVHKHNTDAWACACQTHCPSTEVDMHNPRSSTSLRTGPRWEPATCHVLSLIESSFKVVGITVGMISPATLHAAHCRGTELLGCRACFRRAPMPAASESAAAAALTPFSYPTGLPACMSTTTMEALSEAITGRAGLPRFGRGNAAGSGQSFKAALQGLTFHRPRAWTWV